MKLKPRTPMTALDSIVYGRLGAVSMQPASADKRFRRQLRERNVAVVGLTDGERKLMHELAHKYRRQIGTIGEPVKPEPIFTGQDFGDPRAFEEQETW